MSVREIFLTALRLGFVTFGGPTAHLAWYQTTYVETKKWLTQDEFARIVSLAQILPGPTSSQAGFGIGLKLAGLKGAFAAWVGFTLPGFLLMVVAAAGLSPLINNPRVIQSLKLVVVVIVAHAVTSMALSLIPNLLALAWASTIALVVVFTDSRLGFLLVLFSGVWYARKHLREIRNLKIQKSQSLIWLSFLLLLVTSFFIGGDWLFFGIMLQAGLLVIGGGHVVLPILESGVVGNGLLSISEFLSGYGIVNLMPGPLFNFAAYLGYLNPSPLNGLAGALLATILIFVPGILMMLWLTPKWESLATGNFKLFITGANIAVVGLLAASWWDPILIAVDLTFLKAIVAAIGFILMRRIPLTAAIVLTLTASLLVS
jgi:chromate transporter